MRLFVEPFQFSEPNLNGAFGRAVHYDIIRLHNRNFGQPIKRFFVEPLKEVENLFDESAPADEEVMVEEDYVIDEPAAQPQAAAKAPASDDQVTVITAGTTINGSIVSDCSLNVMGTINGDIECIGKLTISGSVSGNSIASDVYVNAKRLDGNIDSEGTVKIGLGTVVVGDIKAGSAVIAGAVKGELDIKGPVIFDSTAIIKGNVKAKSVQMNNGAVLEGFCSLTYAAVDIDDIFE